MKEIWKPVYLKEFSDLYQVSNLGRVKSLRQNKIMKPVPNNIGALQFIFHRKNHRKHVLLNRLVYFSFFDYEKDTFDLLICKKKYNLKNNYKISNLEAISRKEFYSQGGPHARAH